MPIYNQFFHKNGLPARVFYTTYGIEYGKYPNQDPNSIKTETIVNKFYHRTFKLLSQPPRLIYVCFKLKLYVLLTVVTQYIYNNIIWLGTGLSTIFKGTCCI